MSKTKLSTHWWIGLVAVAAVTAAGCSTDSQYVSEEAITSYASTFVPTANGALFCVTMFNPKNDKNDQIAFAKKQASSAGISGKTGQRASDVFIWSTLVSACDSVYPG